MVGGNGKKLPTKVAFFTLNPNGAAFLSIKRVLVFLLVVRPRNKYHAATAAEHPTNIIFIARQI